MTFKCLGSGHWWDWGLQAPRSESRQPNQCHLKRLKANNTFFSKTTLLFSSHVFFLFDCFPISFLFSCISCRARLPFRLMFANVLLLKNPHWTPCALQSENSPAFLENARVGDIRIIWFTRDSNACKKQLMSHFFSLLFLQFEAFSVGLVCRLAACSFSVHKVTPSTLRYRSHPWLEVGGRNHAFKLSAKVT